jgi:hypothetical protein
MRQHSVTWSVLAAVMMALSAGVSIQQAQQAAAPAAAKASPAGSAPVFQYDATWPKRPLPGNGILGAVLSVAVDDKDHVWVMHWPHWIGEGDDDGTRGVRECCKPMPPVVEFDANGTVVQAWGEIKDPNLPPGGFQWVELPGARLDLLASRRGAPEVAHGGAHGLSIDPKGNVWAGTHSTEGGGRPNVFSSLAKFTRDGKLLIQKGKRGESKGNADTEHFAQPTQVAFNPKTNEAFVSDGYNNRRVIVLDADTMAFKRMWGAYGKPPSDEPMAQRKPGEPPPQQFRLVHCIKRSKDGLLYVCDMSSRRFQVFREDGTYLGEAFPSGVDGTGTVDDVAFSADPGQRFIYAADGQNRKVWILRRDTLEVVGSFGHRGYYPGEFAGYIHSISTDSKGNIYVGEFPAGNRVNRFKLVAAGK